MSPLPFLRGLDVVGAWRTDVRTARRELEATGSQGAVLAAHALAWRLTPVTLPVAVAVGGWLVATGQFQPSALLVGAAAGVLGPQLLALWLTFPLAWFATLQTWYRGSRDARIRFGVTGFVYGYYGWRYAYRGRRRPWGALTREEQVLADPRRAGVPRSDGTW